MGSRRLDPLAALGASMVAGAVAGGSAGLVLVAMSVFADGGSGVSLIEVLRVAPIGALVGSGVGGAVAAVPGVIVGLLLQWLGVTKAAPVIGAIVGATLPSLVFLLIVLANNDNNANTVSDNPTTDALVLLTFVLCGALGGGVGGFLLARMEKKSTPEAGY